LKVGRLYGQKTKNNLEVWQCFKLLIYMLNNQLMIEVFDS